MSNLLVVLITGANQGLGWHACQQLARSGSYHVILGSRNPQKGVDAVQKMLSTNPSISTGVLETVPIDVTSDASIDAAVTFISNKYGRLDVLVNNAGSARAVSPNVTTLREQYQEVFDLNVFSHAVVTEKMLPLLKKSVSPTKRVVFTGSSVGSMTIGQEAGHPFFANSLPIYRTSKSAVNMLMVYYSNILRGDNIAVTSICPGFCATAFNAYRGTDTPENGAAAIVKAVTEGDNTEVTGKWMNMQGLLPY